VKKNLMDSSLLFDKDKINGSVSGSLEENQQSNPDLTSWMYGMDNSLGLCETPNFLDYIDSGNYMNKFSMKSHAQSPSIVSNIRKLQSGNVLEKKLYPVEPFWNSKPTDYKIPEDRIRGEFSGNRYGLDMLNEKEEFHGASSIGNRAYSQSSTKSLKELLQVPLNSSDVIFGHPEILINSPDESSQSFSTNSSKVSHFSAASNKKSRKRKVHCVLDGSEKFNSEVESSSSSSESESESSDDEKKKKKKRRKRRRNRTQRRRIRNSPHHSIVAQYKFKVVRLVKLVFQIKEVSKGQFAREYGNDVGNALGIISEDDWEAFWREKGYRYYQNIRKDEESKTEMESSSSSSKHKEHFRKLLREEMTEFFMNNAALCNIVEQYKNPSLRMTRVAHFFNEKN
jgi:hypothetical protein